MSTITNLKTESIVSSSSQLVQLGHSLDLYIGFQSLGSLETPVWLIEYRIPIHHMNIGRVKYLGPALCFKITQAIQEIHFTVKAVYNAVLDLLQCS